MDLHKLRVFGSKGWAMILPRQDKFDNRSITMQILGYSMNGYKVWNPETDEILIT